MEVVPQCGLGLVHLVPVGDLNRPFPKLRGKCGCNGHLERRSVSVPLFSSPGVVGCFPRVDPIFWSFQHFVL